MKFVVIGLAVQIGAGPYYVPDLLNLDVVYRFHEKFEVLVLTVGIVVAVVGVVIETLTLLPLFILIVLIFLVTPKLVKAVATTVIKTVMVRAIITAGIQTVAASFEASFKAPEKSKPSLATTLWL